MSNNALMIRAMVYTTLFMAAGIVVLGVVLAHAAPVV